MVGALASSAVFAQAPVQAPLADQLDKVAAKWVDDTFKKMTLDDKVGQLVVSSLQSTYLASDTEVFDALAHTALLRWINTAAHNWRYFNLDLNARSTD